MRWKFKVGVRAPLDAVYQALGTREGASAWWTRNTQGRSEVGGTLEFRFSARGVEIGGFQMKILELDPNRRVQWEVIGGPSEWIGTRIRFDLSRNGDYSVVLFKHEGWREAGEFMHHCSTKWAVYLMSLKSLLETGSGTPNPDDPHISGNGPD